MLFIPITYRYKFLKIAMFINSILLHCDLKVKIMIENEEETGSLTIRIDGKTRKRIEKLGVFGQSWNDVLNDMVDFIEEHEEEWFEEEEEEE